MCEFSLHHTMFVIVLVRLCSYHVCSCTRASSVKLVEMVSIRYHISVNMCTLLFHLLSHAHSSLLRHSCSIVQESLVTFDHLIRSYFHSHCKHKCRIQFVSDAGPTLWKSLPDQVKSAGSFVTFCHHFKIRLFYLA